MSARIAPFTMLLALVLVPLAQAGNEASPEVTDAAGDGSICVMPPACSPSQGFVDVLKAWVVDASPTAFEVHLLLSAAPPTFGPAVGAPDPITGCGLVQAGASMFYKVTYDTVTPAGDQVTAMEGSDPKDDNFVYATVACDTSVSKDPTAVEFGHGVDYTSSLGGSYTLKGLVAGQITGAQIVWTVPRDAAEVGLPAGAAALGYKITKLAAHSTVLVGEVGTFNADDGPDSGFGSDYVFAASAAAAPIYQPVTTTAFGLVAQNPTMTNATYIYNWTNTQMDLDLAYGAVATTGMAHVLVKDSANATVLDQMFPGQNGTNELTTAQTGPWQVTVQYTNFTGELSLAMAKHEATSTVTPTSTASSTTGPTPSTSSSATSGAADQGATSGSSTPGKASTVSSTTKGSPAIGFLSVMAVLGVGILLVRRRL